MKYKVAYKGDGTKEVGKKIIDELERLGELTTGTIKVQVTITM